MKKRRKFIKIAIDSPAAAGAGTLAKTISKHYNLLYLDTGKIYRMLAFIKLNQKASFNYKFLKKKIKTLNLKSLQNSKLLSDEVGTEASLIAKETKIRKLVHSFQNIISVNLKVSFLLENELILIQSNGLKIY